MKTLDDFNAKLDALSQQNPVPQQPSESDSAPQQESQSIPGTGALTPEETAQFQHQINVTNTHNAFQDGATSFGVQLAKILGAAVKGGYELAGNKEGLKGLEAGAKELEQNQQDAATASPLASSIGGSLPSGIIGAGVAAATGGLGAIGSAIAGGAAMGATSPGNINPDLSVNLKNTAMNTAMGAGLGGIGAAAAPLLSKIPSLGSLGGDAETAAKAATLQKYGINPAVPTDLSASPVVKGLQNSVEALPGGREQIAKALEEQQASIPQGIDTFNKFVTRGAAGDITGLNDSIEKAIQTQIKPTIAAKFDAVDKAAAGTDSMVDTASLKDHYTNVMSNLGADAAGSTKQIGKILDKVPDQISFDRARQLRSDLSGELTNLARQGATSVETNGLPKLRELLDKNIDDWAINSGRPEVSKLYADARGYYHQYMTTIGNGALRQDSINGAALTDFSNKLLGMGKNINRFSDTANFLGQDVKDSIASNKINQMLAASTNKQNFVDLPKFSQLLSSDPQLKAAIGNTPHYQAVQDFAGALQRLKMPKQGAGIAEGPAEMAGIGATIMGHPIGLLYNMPGYVAGKLLTSEPFMKLMKAVKVMPTSASPELMTRMSSMLVPYIKNTNAMYKSVTRTPEDLNADEYK